MLQKKNSYIYSFEGKDVYNKVLKVKENKKRKATLDYSLETIKIEEIAKNIFNKRKRKYENLFFQEGDKQYTNAIVNMTFKYNAYEYNMLTLKKDKYYVHYESNVESKDLKDIEFKDGLYITKYTTYEDGVPVIKDRVEVVKIGELNENKNIKLPKGFKRDKENKIALTTSGFKVIDNSDEIRKKIYMNGFKLNYNDKEEVKYVRFKRSGGASRVGKCLFIREELFKAMIEWSVMGLIFKNDQPIDLAGIQAYISLTTSSIIDTIKIEPKNILLIDDYKSTFEDKVMVTEIVKQKYINDNGDEDERDRLMTYPKEIEITNNIWDGQSLLDESIFEEYGYKDKGFLLGRNQFFKSACFNCGIQRFFENNGIVSISQLNGKTIATDIKDIKLITTPSSIKYLKYGTWEEWISKLDSTFGVVKYDKPTHYFRGKMVQTHYQLLNTLQLSEEDMEEFLSDSLEYIRLLKTDIRVFREHLHIKIKENIEYGDMKSTDEFMMTMLQLNNKFENTDLFNKFRQESIQSYIKNIKRGHVLINGNYSVLCGNGFEMLKNSCNLFDGVSLLGTDEVVCRNFEYEKELIGSRSPHVTMGNIWLPKNANKEKSKSVLEYFNGSKQIVYVNSIKNNLLERLSSADFDSDSVLLSDNELLISKAKLNYKNFLVPTSDVSAKKIPRFNTSEEMCDLDIKTSKNLIGQIINCSQILNSMLWDLINKGKNTGDKIVQDLYADISQLDVMSCIEIDKAKKEFSIDNQLELDALRDKWINKNKKPMFFKFLAKDKGNPIKVEKYREYKTSMDYLIKTVNKGVRNMKRLRIREGDNTRTTFGNIFSKEYKINLHQTNNRKANNVLNSYNILKSNISNIWSNPLKDNEDKFNETKLLKDDFMTYIKKCNLDCKDIKKIIIQINSEMNNKEITNTYRSLLSSIYFIHKEEFIKIFEETKDEVEYLIMRNKSEPYKKYIKLYGILYEIV